MIILVLVSIIVPSYNHAAYLEARIESILNQTYQNFELILLDDLSPDHSQDILKRYRDHPKVSHCIINEKNSGSTFFQWNKGLHLAKGEIIWIAESDDIADPKFLETLLPHFEQDRKLVLAYCQSYRMRADGEITGTWKTHTDDLDSRQFDQDFKMHGMQYISQYLSHKNTIPNASAVLFKKQVYFDVGGADAQFKYNGDWDIWAKIVSCGEIYFSSNHYNYFRYHPQSVIAQAQNNKEKTLSVFLDEIKLAKNLIFFLKQKNILEVEQLKSIRNLNRILDKNNKRTIRHYVSQKKPQTAILFIADLKHQITIFQYIKYLLKYLNYRLKYQ